MAADDAQIEALDPDLVAGLADPRAYPDDASAAGGVQHIQTHLSHVFLTGARVYKLHKAVRFGFVDFATRALRNTDSLRETRLNRRLAEDVYLGVSPVECRNGRVRVGASSEELGPAAPGEGVAEHCVVMRRLPDGGDALSMIERGALRERHIDAIAARIAEFHARSGLGAPAPFPQQEWLARVTSPVRDCFREIAASAPFSARADSALARAEAIVERDADRFERRRLAGRVVDGHGDLHLAHVWFEQDDAPPLAIDCLEFRDDYRQIDAASEVSFLAMDLEYRGRRDLGERFLRRYAEQSDDFDLYSVVDFFAAYRAAVRAKVACLAARDAQVPDEQRAGAEHSAARHLSLAEGALAEAPIGSIIAMTGIVGSGKSSVAHAVADALDAVVISSDRVRKRLSNLPPTARGHGEIYSEAHSAATYAGLLERAAPVLRSGRTAILDATHSTESLRADLRAWASALGARAILIESRCAESISRERLAARAARGSDPSDAGPDFYATSAEAYEPIAAWPEADRALVRTDEADWRDPLARVLRRFPLSSAEARIR